MLRCYCNLIGRKPILNCVALETKQYLKERRLKPVLSKDDHLHVWFAKGGNENNIPKEFRGGRSKTAAKADLIELKTAISEETKADFRNGLVGHHRAVTAERILKTRGIIKQAKEFSSREGPNGVFAMAAAAVS